MYSLVEWLVFVNSQLIPNGSWNFDIIKQKSQQFKLIY